MEQPRWELIKSLVDSALTLSGRERDTFIAKVRRDYPNISNDVIELLEHIEESERLQFLQEVQSDQKNMLLDISGNLIEVNRDETFINEEIGPYRITEIIGRGGMGTVFKASRADDEFQQDVAIKIIKPGYHTGNNVLRFRIEREILAGLQHPNIAHLYDGGVTDKGLHYLVMEYIHGMPIDQYCDKHRLTINERLDIFQKVCSAVQFAHKNLIVHRVLKAQNIYVNNEGIVKILDFGIAKLLNPPQRHVSSVETLPGQRIWTPQYAAPEQVKGEPITVATDIYALGVLLHHVLTGSYPYDLEGKKLVEIEDTIKKSPPVMPSISLASLSDPKKCAENRKTTVQEMKHSLQGDLDALVSKAIRKEPEYRYDSVLQLSEDIDRFKSGDPLIARAGTVRYRASKFIRRNKGLLAAVTTIVMIIFLFTGFYTWKITEERNMAQLERDKLEQVVDFMTGLFESSNPVETQGEALTAVDLLNRGIEQASELNDQPVLQAEMLSVIGSSFRSMNRPEKATPLLEKALQIQRKYWGQDHAEIANTLNTLGSVYWSDKQYEQADKYLYEALQMRRHLYGNNHPSVFTSMNNYALVLQNLGKMDEAEKLFTETLQGRKKYYGKEHSKVGVSLNNLAFFLQRRGKYEKAEKYFRETLSIWRKIQGEEHSDVAIALLNLGSLLRELDKYDEAEQMLRQSLEIRKKVYGPSHLKVGYCLNNLALVLNDKKEYDEAMHYASQSLELFKNFHESEHRNISTALTVLGKISSENGRFNQAENHFVESLRMQSRLYPENHIWVAYARNNLGKLYVDYALPEQAEPLLTNALAVYENYYGNNNVHVARLKGALGTCYLQKSQYDHAESLILDEYHILKNISGVYSGYLQESLNRLIELYRDWGKTDRANKYREELYYLEKMET